MLSTRYFLTAVLVLHPSICHLLIWLLSFTRVLAVAFHFEFIHLIVMKQKEHESKTRTKGISFNEFAEVYKVVPRRSMYSVEEKKAIWSEVSECGCVKHMFFCVSYCCHCYFCFSFERIFSRACTHSFMYSK